MLRTHPAPAPPTRTPSRPGAGLVPRAAAALAVIAGLAGVLLPLVLGGLTRAGAGQEMLDGARDSASVEGSDRLAADAALLIAGGDELISAELPTLGGALGLDEAELQAVLAERFPGVAAGVEGFPAAADALERIVANLQAHAADYEQADALPVQGVSLPLATVLTMVTSAVLAVLGVLAWRTDRRGLRVALVVVPLASLSFVLASRSPQKAAAAERVLASLRLDEAAVLQVESHFTATDTLLRDYREQLLPAAAAELGVPEAALASELDAAYPAAAQLRSRAGADALANIAEDVSFRRRNLDNFALLRGEPLGLYLWVSAAVFALLTASALAALADRRRGA